MSPADFFNLDIPGTLRKLWDNMVAATPALEGSIHTLDEIHDASKTA